MGNKLKDKLYRNKSLLVGAVGVAVSIMLLLNTLSTPTIKPTKYVEFAKTAVMITRLDGRSGGTGVILESHKNESKILTNQHVCAVVKNGGIVRSDSKSAFVKYYQVSQIHDICLITVATNFKVNTIIAEDSPEAYDVSVVSGHPALMSTLITHGHFSEKQVVEILVGFRRCTKEEWESERTGFACFLFGGFPIIRTYEAQLTSNMIMPGSSGSAVFNENGEIAGLVFAGRQGLSYALVVPHEYIAAFLKYELPESKKIQPSSIGFSVNDDDFNKILNWPVICQSNDNEVQKICKLIERDVLIRL